MNDRDDLCPLCGADQTSDLRTYDKKLVDALRHPLPQARARICWLIGENKIQGAVPRLMEIADSDPDIYVQKAAVEALGTIGDPISDKLLRSISQSANRFLAISANKSLKTGKRQA
jgi:HEAT repeat protein